MVDRAALVEVLRRDGRLAGWDLVSVDETSVQRLFRATPGGLRAHQSREVRGRELKLRGYVDLDGAVGIGALDLDPLASLPAQVALCVEMARGARNAPWTRPGPPAGGYPEVTTCDPDLLADPLAGLERIQASLQRAIDAEGGVRFNSAEIYVTAGVHHLLTDHGIDIGRSYTDIDVDLAVEPLPGPNHQEVHDRAGSLAEADLDLPRFVARCATEARQLGRSELPPSSSALPILLHATEIAVLLDGLHASLMARLEYHQRAPVRAGEDLHTGQLVGGSDRLHLSVDPSRPAMVLSRAATAEGQVPRGGVLVEGNRVVRKPLDSRYAQYLGVEPNHLEGNLVVPPGSRTLASLVAEGGPKLEILKFSSLHVNPSSLTWSSEVKLGRLHHRSGGTTWIKGGVVAGNLRENLRDFTMSSETAVVNRPGVSFEPALGYVGPAAMLLRAGVSVTGAATAG